MKRLTLKDIASLIAELQDALNVDRLGKLAVTATEAAQMLSVPRSRIYQMHYEGILNGFKPYRGAPLHFAVDEVKGMVAKMRDERRNA